MKTLQECFDISFLGLKAQGHPSYKDDDMCAYRGKDGGKCAVGHLIEDDELAIAMDEEDDSSIGAIYASDDKSLAERLGIAVGPWETHQRLLDGLQYIHDHWCEHQCEPDYLAMKYRTIAKDYGLDDSVTYQ